MTCIVGAVGSDGTVYIGGDSAVSSGWVSWVAGDLNAKVVERGEGKSRMLVGLTGYLRDTQVLEYIFDPPYHRDDYPTMQYMVKEYVPALRTSFEKEKRLVVKDGDAHIQSHFLVAYRGLVMHMDSAMCVTNHSEIGYAIGSGQEPALGALYATRDDPDIKKRLTVALEAAARWIPSVAPPFHIRELPPLPGDST